MQLTWYFDFISPFAYLQLQRFQELPESVNVVYKPILFAGLLNHWQNVGPAEIVPKRQFTYQFCYWYARKNNVPFKMPPAHPFNSLFALRLAVALGNQLSVIQTIFNGIWRYGYALESIEAMRYFEEQFARDDLAELVSQASVKEQLKHNTQLAAEQQVFGVPTFTVADGQENFWGLDAFDMLVDFIQSPQSFNDEEMLRVKSLPEGIQRKR
ncbi:2-hydroxychromene-2-carboxylate isomerase [Aliikangiella maris]|uniref:DsbA family protein n=2 Tax=Aliikangiella maris TaxID=3162458 RepID=A0ABV2BV87_9GAMM